MIFHEQPDEPWSKHDFLLLEAFQMLKNETCPKCGQPVWLCRSESNEFEWKIDSFVCQAERLLKTKEWKRTAKKGEKVDPKERAEWGKEYYAYPEPLRDAGFTELPTRAAFYDSLRSKDT